MTSASSQLVQKPAPEMVEIKNIFFKAHPTLNYFADEAQAEAVDNEEAFKNCNRALECSNKYGCLLLSFNESLYLLRVSDVVSEGGNLQFEAVKKLKIVNAAMPVAPNIIALSNGENFLAVDTVRLNHEAFVLVFDFAEFIKTAGTCRPICEIRCSATSRVRGVGWNPGENMNGIIAINTNEGALYMAKINGPNNVEFNKFAESDVRSLCWSPRGKQLVVGRTNGTLTQLKVELTMAKNIPAPEPGCLPVAIQWTQTTQFLVLYQRRDEGRSELMQIDVVKGATPTYRNSGDIFIQDIYHEMTSCYFLPLTQWNTILAMVNCATDIVVLVKKTEDNQEVWAPADIADNRRAAFLLDNYARGVALFNGSEKRVTFSEVESYNPMPMLFLLSQRGSLSIYSIVNDDPNAASLQVKVSGSVSDSIFSVVPPASQQKPQLSTQPRQVSQVQPTAPNPPQLVQQPVQVASSITPKPASPFSFGGVPGQKPLFQVPSSQQTATQPPPTSLFQSSSSLFKANPISSQPVSAAAAFPQAPLQQQPQQMKPAILSGGGDAFVQQQNQQLQKPDIRQLGTSTLSASLDFEGLQKAVEEKRRGMTTQLQNSGSGAVAAIRNLDNDDQCGFVVEEVQKFEERLANFKEGMLRNRNTLHNLLKACNTSLEKSVLTTLNSVEDFTTDMVSITNSQKEEVEVLKERILNHFSQLEYAKSLVERSRDPRYIEHLRSRPLDPASQQRFEEICKFHNYIKNQLSECRRYYYDQHRKRDKPLDRAPNTQLIYMTLSNHSKIIRRLKAELDNIKERLGLGKHSGVIDEAEFLAVCEASYSGQKKESNNNTNGHSEDQEEISLNDLTSGISKVKLNRDSSRPDKKPIQFSNRKLLILRKSMTEVSVVKVKAEESAWTRIPSKPTRPSVQAQATSATIQQPNETTQVKFQQQSSMTPSVFESSPTINKTDGVASQFQTQQQPNFARAPPPSASSFVASPKSGVSSPTTVSITPGVPGTSTPIGSPFAPKQNTVISSTTQKATPQSTTANYFNAPKDTSAASPTVQNPTLAGLLASPSTLPSTPKPTPGTVSSGLPTMSIDFSSAFGATSGGKSLFSSEVISSGSKQEDKQQSNISTTSNKPAILQEKPPTNSSTLIATPTTPKSSTVVAKPSAPESLHTAKPVTPASSTEVAKPPSSMFSFTAAATPPAASAITGATDSTKTQPVPFSFSTPSTTKSAILSTKTTTTSSGLFLSPITSTTGNTGLSFGFASGLNLTTSSSKGPGLFGTPPATTAAEAIGVKIPPGITITTTNVSATSTTIPAAVAPTAVSSAPLLQKALETSAVSNTASTPPTATTISKTAEVAPGTSTVASITSGSFSFSGSPAISSITPASGTPTSATSITGGLFTSPSTPATIAATSATGIFGSGGAISFTSPATGLFGSPTTATTAGTTPGIFGSSTTTATTAGGTPGIFGSTTTPTSATPSLFGTPTSQVTATTATTGLFSSISTTPVATSGSTPAPTAPAGFFTQITTTPATAPISNFMSSLGIGTSASTATPSSTAGGGLFSSSPFGSSTTSAAPAPNIFGGGTSTFGTQPATTAQQNVFGGGIFGGAAAKTTSSSNVFGASSPPTASVFGGAGATPSFGSSPSSPFGSSFGGSTAPAFGGGSVFGSTAAATSASQPSGFGTTSATTAFGGGSVFGSGGGGTFGSPAAASGSTGLFSSTFGSSTTSTTSAGGIFGATFGSGTPATGGAFSAGGGGVGQQGFGFGQTKPTTTGSLFGTTPTAAPVFGGGATFGSTSPFGASFSASPQQQTTTFGSAAAAGGSVFGGSAGSQALGFGALAQGGGSGGGFGNTFGSTSPQQQQQSPSFGSSPQPPQSSSFTSWR